MDFRHIYIIAQLLLAFSLTTWAQRSTENYVQTTMRISDSQTKTVVQYYDGLGRLKEEVELGVTPQHQNLLHLHQHDGLGRENYAWLPIVESTDFVSDASSSAQSQYADTYCIYDIRGNLSYVLPPNYQDEPDINLYAYQYKYDGRGNCVWKKLPGVEPTSMVYDRSHHMVYLQDGNLRKQGLWKFMISDQVGRPVVSGLTFSTSNISNVRVYAHYTGSGSLDGYQVYGISPSVHSYLTIYYYDDYSFVSHVDTNLVQQLKLDANKLLESVFPSNSAPNAKGFLTGKKLYLTDGSGKALVSSYYYGRQGRVIQSHTSNYLDGWKHINMSYTYAGSPLKSSHIHTAVGKRTITENYTYEYDHAGRLTQTKYNINGSTDRVLSSINYDEYGRMATQTLLEQTPITYSYNLRNWPFTIESDKLKLQFAYNSQNENLYAMKSCYGGNISSMSWQLNNELPRAFFFYYNKQNMLTESYYGEGEHFSDARNRYTEYLSYDKMGNIRSLQRSGLRDDEEYGLIDDLNYTYNGNNFC